MTRRGNSSQNRDIVRCVLLSINDSLLKSVSVKRWTKGDHATFTQDELLVRRHNKFAELNPGILQLIRTQ